MAIIKISGKTITIKQVKATITQAGLMMNRRGSRMEKRTSNRHLPPLFSLIS
jgi:hypothetical protein